MPYAPSSVLVNDDARKGGSPPGGRGADKGVVEGNRGKSSPLGASTSGLTFAVSPACGSSSTRKPLASWPDEDYQARTNRRIAVIVLEPAQG